MAEMEDDLRKSDENLCHGVAVSALVKLSFYLQSARAKGSNLVREALTSLRGRASGVPTQTSGNCAQSRHINNGCRRYFVIIVQIWFWLLVFIWTRSYRIQIHRCFHTTRSKNERKREIRPRTQRIPRCRRRKVTKRKSIFLSETIKIYTVDLNDKLVTETIVKSWRWTVKISD